MHGQFPARAHPDFLSNSGDEQAVGVNEEAAEGILNTEKLQGSRHGRPAQGDLVTAGPQRALSQQLRQGEDGETGKRRVSGQEHKGQEDKQLKAGSRELPTKGIWAGWGKQVGGRQRNQPGACYGLGGPAVAGRGQTRAPWQVRWRERSQEQGA